MGSESLKLGIYRNESLRTKRKALEAREAELVDRERMVAMRERQVAADQAQIAAERERLASAMASVAAANEARAAAAAQTDEETENIPLPGGEDPRVSRVASRPSLVPRRPLEERKSTYVNLMSPVRSELADNTRPGLISPNACRRVRSCPWTRHP
jgi:hypothetical protein